MQRLQLPCTTTCAQLNPVSIAPQDMLMEKMVKGTQFQGDGGQMTILVQGCNLFPKQVVTGIHLFD